jgi:hypothetical protein
MTASPDFHAEWVAALDRLEVDVELAERALAEAHEPVLELPDWEPPAVRGPLPSDLEPRARLVLERQVAIAYFLTERLTANTQHRRYTQAVRNTASPDIPVYLDISA